VASDASAASAVKTLDTIDADAAARISRRDTPMAVVLDIGAEVHEIEGSGRGAKAKLGAMRPATPRANTA
jgi:hypothetical protein